MDKFSTLFLGGSLFIIMLGMGLSLEIKDFKRIFVYPKAIFIGLFSQLIILPIIGFLIAASFSVSPAIAIGIMILAACPGGPTSNLIAHLANGNTALSVTLTAISSFVTIFTIPFIVNFSTEYFIQQGAVVELDVLAAILQIMVITIVPICCGMTIRRYKFLFAERMAPNVKIASGIVIILVIVGIVVKEKDNVVDYFEQAGIVALTLNVASMLVGFCLPCFFNIKRDSAVSISIESGIQNGTLAITIAVVMLGNSTFAIAPAVYSLIMFFTGSAFVFLHLNRKK
ncbi:bile acid:sodium symporter family protein [Prolixibacteraceae bacterium JC049]|nr:bile acid:sodium symporter family protein [Prolixibacteraceae bacterium JC049]